MKLHHFSRFAIGVGVFLWLAAPASGQYTVTPLDVPGAVSTIPKGFAGSSVFGSWFTSNQNVNGTGFLFDGTSFTTLSTPPGLSGAYVAGIANGLEVGGYRDPNGYDHGYIYDGTTLTTLDDPLATHLNGINGFTDPTGIYAGTIVGQFSNDSGIHGFIYDGSTFTTLDAPGASDTYITGTDGHDIVGYCNRPVATVIDGKLLTSSVTSGFIYNGSGFTFVDDPNANGATYINGVSGGVVVGSYYASIGYLEVLSHGFIYDGNSFTTLDGPPGVLTAGSELTAISGNTIIGDYVDGNTVDTHGFVVTLPEPASVAIVCICSVWLTRRRRR